MAAGDTDPTEVKDAVLRAFEPVLKELLRFAFVHDIAPTEFEARVRRCALWLAKERIEESGAPVTAARLSVDTGFPQFYVHEAMEYLSDRTDSDRRQAALMTKLMLLVSTWNSDAPFVGPHGIPLELNLNPNGPGATFQRLLDDTGVELTQDEALEALKRVGVIEHIGDTQKLVRVITQTVSYKNETIERIERYGELVTALARTLRFNAERPKGETRFEQNLFTDRPVPDIAFDDFHDLVTQGGLKWLRELDSEQRGFRAGPKQRARKWGVGVFLYDVPGSEVDGTTFETEEEEVIDVLAPRRPLAKSK